MAFEFLKKALTSKPVKYDSRRVKGPTRTPAEQQKWLDDRKRKPTRNQRNPSKKRGYGWK